MRRSQRDQLEFDRKSETTKTGIAQFQRQATPPVNGGWKESELVSLRVEMVDLLYCVLLIIIAFPEVFSYQENSR